MRFPAFTGSGQDIRRFLKISICKQYDLVKPMVLIIDGNSELGEHVRSNFYYWIFDFPKEDEKKSSFISGEWELGGV